MKRTIMVIHVVLLASMNGKLETVEWLVNNGCSTNERNNFGNSCLLYASLHGHLETLNWLIENGCSLEERNYNESNCILQASRGGNIPMIQYLLKKGFSLQDTNKYGTCVMNAAICERIKTVIWMLSNGSSISESEVKKKSCKSMLKTNGMYEIVSFIHNSKSSRK